jgi:superfamily II DNA or RNA helicase
MLDDVQKNRIAIFRALTMLRQLSLAPSLVDDDYAAIEASKIDVLMGQVREVVAEGHRALVFSQFTGFLKLVRTRLEAAGIGYSYLDGRTRDRAARIAAFREGDDPLFLISLKAGGFGLTLTEADYVFILDPWWNPAAEEQAIDRTHRIGQDKTVMVYRLVATDTIEEKVVALQDRKRRLFADVVGAEDPRRHPRLVRALIWRTPLWQNRPGETALANQAAEIRPDEPCCHRPWSPQTVVVSATMQLTATMTLTTRAGDPSPANRDPRAPGPLSGGWSVWAGARPTRPRSARSAAPGAWVDQTGSAHDPPRERRATWWARHVA